MILAIDVGNTHISFGCVQADGSVGQVFQMATDPAETGFGYAARMQQILALGGVETAALEGAVLSCVVPPALDAVRSAVQLLTGQQPLTVGAGVKTGLPLAIDDPGDLAGDLVAAAVAARAEYPLPCIIVDMGTATTVTVVDENGRYIGGCILPGAGIALHALAQNAALLPRIDITPPQKAIATNTLDSMKAGIVFGSAGAVDGILDRYAAALGREPASIVATGGLCGAVCPHCRHDIRCDATLVLKGLGILWRKNRPLRSAAAPNE